MEVKTAMATVCGLSMQYGIREAKWSWYVLKEQRRRSLRVL